MPTLITLPLWHHGFRRVTPTSEERYSLQQRNISRLTGCVSTKKVSTVWTLGSEWPSFFVVQTFQRTRRNTLLAAGRLIGPSTLCSQSGPRTPNHGLVAPSKARSE